MYDNENRSTAANGHPSHVRIPVDLLIVNGYVLTMDSQNKILEDGAIVIREGRIVAIGSTCDMHAKYYASEEINAHGMAVLPGLIDTYDHAGHGLNKGIHHPEIGWPTNELHFHATTSSWWRAEGRLASLERVRSRS
jgi:cytosine/adenosine deaminase-related metal-dependent hydrolase